jgi:hypothetical protein
MRRNLKWFEEFDDEQKAAECMAEIDRLYGRCERFQRKGKIDDFRTVLDETHERLDQSERADKVIPFYDRRKAQRGELPPELRELLDRQVEPKELRRQQREGRELRKQAEQETREFREKLQREAIEARRAEEARKWEQRYREQREQFQLPNSESATKEPEQLRQEEVRQRSSSRTRATETRASGKYQSSVSLSDFWWIPILSGIALLWGNFLNERQQNAAIEPIQQTQLIRLR